jgi:hypothetical protein
MKRLLLFTTLSLLFVACGNRQKEKRYLPTEVAEEVYFNMPLDDFKALKGSKVEQIDDGMSFRKVFFEQQNDGLVEFLGYYFDTEGESPLYEVIIGYKEEASVGAESVKLLGEPNYKEKEWKFEVNKSFDILAWTYEKKLIIVALIPDTEWYEDVNKE